MSNPPIALSELGAADPLDGTEQLPVVQGGTTLRTTAGDVAGLVDQTTVPITTKEASHTLELADAGVVLRMDAGTSLEVTVPANSAVAFPVGTVVNVRQINAPTSIVAASGVTVSVPFGLTLALEGAGHEVSLHKVATDTWEAVGGFEAS